MNTQPATLRMSLGSRIRDERKRLKLSQARFAELCGVKRRMQIYIEQDEMKPGSAYLQAAAVEAGADVQYALTGVRISGTSKPHFRRINGAWIEIQRRTA